MIITHEISYDHQGTTLKGFFAYNEKIEGKKPVVLVMHDWSGCNDLAKERAMMLAHMGYVGFAVDNYGNGIVGQTDAEKAALMTPLIDDRALLTSRVLCHLSQAKALEHADPNKIAAIGFCFGGLCVLDLARTGEAIKGVVSFHGLLSAPHQVEETPILSKILVLHGYDDPMAKPEQVIAFCDEMTRRNADWQVDMYGHTQHAFTNPAARDKNAGLVYHEKSQTRAFIAMGVFLKEIFA
jgi:dienelactone hydrolase